MSKKTLLNEASVRKFMKFAKIDHYTDSFINETYTPMEEGEYEDKMEEGAHTEEEGDESPAPPADDAPPADVDPMPSDDGAMEGTINVEDFMSALETALETVIPDDVQIDMDGMDDMGAMDDEGGDDEGGDDEVAGEMDLVDDEEVLEETLRRVSARLNRMVETKKTSARKSRMVESVTDRIMARIQKGE